MGGCDPLQLARNAAAMHAPMQGLFFKGFTFLTFSNLKYQTWLW
jgi:hypothetical protein